MKCQKITLVKGGYFIGTYKKCCDKEAVIKSPTDNRMLCQHHYNKIVKPKGISKFTGLPINDFWAKRNEEYKKYEIKKV